VVGDGGGSRRTLDPTEGDGDASTRGAIEYAVGGDGAESIVGVRRAAMTRSRPREMWLWACVAA
jgi:hypothetical protein